MKKSKKLIFGALATASTALVVTPLVTSCSNSSDIKQVGRGDGKYFATYKFNGTEQKITFAEVLAEAAASKDGFAAFKQQIAKELVYNWYQGIKDSSKAPQSFKDNWKTWTDDAQKAYDDKVQSYKNSHKKSWEYYFQNEVLDPVGGNKDAFIRQQMYDKVYDAFKNLVFANNYLAYTSEENPTVNSSINSFSETIFNDSANWKKIDFYAKANTSYRVDTQDLDDVYAITQKQAFDAYTLNKHPQALLMALWKYAAPTEGMYEVYSKNIPATDEEKKEEEKKNNSADLKEETTKTLKAKYETPAFPKWDGTGKYTANAKFQNLVTDFFISPTYGSGTFNLDGNGMFRYNNQGSIYQDDGSTMGFVLNMDEMYSKLDAWFCPAVTQLYESGMFIANQDSPNDNFLNYPVSKLILNNDGTTDILYNFFFRAKDSRTEQLASVKTLVGKGALDLSKTFKYAGTADDSSFHSSIFLNSPSAVGDYYGANNPEEGGVQYVVNALWLTDDYGNRLPYILFRDTNGVHLCGLYGAWNYKTTPTASGATPDKGYLAVDASDDNNNTEPWSQGRQNIMLKALNLFMKTRNESLFDITSEVKTYFTSNADEIIINMALNETKRGDKDNSTIFKLSDVLDSGVTKDDLETVLKNSTIYFLLQGTLTSYLEANKKLYGLMSSHISNSVMSRSSGTSLEGFTSDNYKNAVATPMPYIGEYKNSEALPNNNAASSNDLYTGFLTFPITNASIWVNAKDGSGTLDLITDPGKDTWESSITHVTANATNFLEKGITTILEEYTSIISALKMTSATLPNSSYSKWSEHLNPTYSYNKDKATNAVGNGLYMALNKYLDGSQLANRIKLGADIAYADKDDSIFEDTGKPSYDNLFLGQIKNTGKFSGLRDAVAGMMYSNKLFTSDTPLSFYTSIVDPDNVSAEAYRNEIERLGKQSIAHNATSGSVSDDLISYWTFIDTLQYLVNNDYAKLIDYLQTSVMSYGVEADLVWVTEDNKDANPNFVNTDDISDFGWKENYDGKYSYTYLPTDGSSSEEETYNTPSTYADNSAYYQAAPLKYGTEAGNSMLGMGFAGLVTSSSAPAVITSTLQNALFTDTYKSKVTIDAGTGTKDQHLGGWYKYGSPEKLVEYIKTLSSVADIQKMATNLGAANEDPLFTANVVDVVKRATFQSGDPELKVTGTPFKDGQALTPEVLRARLLGGNKVKVQGIEVDYDTWGLTYYYETSEDLVNDLFTRFGGADLATGNSNGVAQELYAVDSNRHAMRVTSDETGGTYAKMMVIQLNNADFQKNEEKDWSAVQNLNYALTGDEDDYTLLNYIAVQYAQQASLQTQATNDVVKTILGDDNKVTVYDRRLNDKLGSTWVKNYKATN